MNDRNSIHRELWLGILAVVILLTLTPGRFIPEWAHGETLHFLAYAVLATLALVIIRSTRIAWFAVSVACFLSLALEFVQVFIPGRSFQESDMIAGVSGLVTGAVVGSILRRRGVSM